MVCSAHVVSQPAVAPADAFLRLAESRGVVWLDSSLTRDGDGRFSIMAVNPAWEFSSRGDSWDCRIRDGTVEAGTAGAWSRMDDLLDQKRVEPPADVPDLPFYGGAMGWFSYDLGRQFESIHDLAQDDLAWPDIYLAWYEAAIVWDHAQDAVWLVGIAGADGQAAMAELRERLTKSPSALRSAKSSARPGTARSNLSRVEYLRRVEAAREGIARGEFYQMNLVQRFACAHVGSAAETYLRLRERNPAPFGAFLSTGYGAILSSSPERFIEVSPFGEVRTCPIKGTRPRGSTEAQDAVRRAELQSSAKERAELLMIVDLLRNDLGRVCVPGSINVQRLHALESFATVHHLVGEVRGQLRPGVTRRELLRAVFPGGSITGAPKVSAMQAIDRLEPHRRGVAMGAIGLFSAHGRMDFNVAIRTILICDDVAYVPVGAGIVWDSDPAAEYAETLAKGRALFDALRVEPLES